jgi:sirohydrochlorin cobaltochelatase
LLSVSFGTSYEETRAKTIDVVDADLAAAFPDRAFYRAWTSGIIIKKVKAERGEHHDTLDEAFARMSADGVDDLVVATMCLMQGGEMNKVSQAAAAWAAEGNRTVRLAKPLMSDEADQAVVARALCDELADVAQDDAVLLMGHGTKEDGFHGANGVYAQLQDELHALGRDRFFVATVEGTPTFDDALLLLEGCGAKRVVLAPFMIVAGDHARNDLAGDDGDSWASQLAARGFETEVVLKGLGEYAAIQDLVVEHAREAQEG